MTNQLFAQRISPSGPLLGSPAVLVGGGQIDGRCWRAQGSGDSRQIPAAIPPVPSFAVWPSVPGLEMVPVDFRTGYGYDFSLDIVASGADEAPAQQYQIIALMSEDGIIWTPFGGRSVNCFDVRADGRYHFIYFPQFYPAWTLVRIVLFNNGAATPDLTYLPSLAVLTIQEFTSS